MSIFFWAFRYQPERIFLSHNFSFQVRQHPLPRSSSPLSAKELDWCLKRSSLLLQVHRPIKSSRGGTSRLPTIFTLLFFFFFFLLLTFFISQKPRPHNCFAIFDLEHTHTDTNTDTNTDPNTDNTHFSLSLSPSVSLS